MPKTRRPCQRIIECRSQLYQNCPAVLVQSIRDKIQQLNSKLFQFLHQIKTQKFTNLVGPSRNLEPPKDNQLAVVTIPNNFPLSEPEKSVLSKGLNFVPIAIHSDEGLTLETSVFESQFYGGEFTLSTLWLIIYFNQSSQPITTRLNEPTANNITV